MASKLCSAEGTFEELLQFLDGAAGLRAVREVGRHLRCDGLDVGVGRLARLIERVLARSKSPLLVPTLKHASESVEGLPEGASVPLDRGYDSNLTCERLKERGLVAEIAKKGQPVPLHCGRRWVVERTDSWHNAYKKLLWCTERKGRVIEFWVAFSEVVIIVRRLIRESSMRYRWEGCPPLSLLFARLLRQSCEQRYPASYQH